MENQLSLLQRALLETESNLYRLSERRSAILNQIQAIEQISNADGLKPVNPMSEQTSE